MTEHTDKIEFVFVVKEHVPVGENNVITHEI